MVYIWNYSIAFISSKKLKPNGNHWIVVSPHFFKKLKRNKGSAPLPSISIQQMNPINNEINWGVQSLQQKVFLVR
jgi:hypothetical protein